MLFLFIFCLISGLTCSKLILLDGPDWTYRSYENNFTGKALVPGDIYSDLYRNGQINNPLYGNGDQDYLWVGRTSWIYEKIFNLSQDVINSNEIIMAFDSLDTIATIYLNNHLIATSKNAFVPVQLNINKTFIQLQGNNLTIAFESPVIIANKSAQTYISQKGHIMPQDCPVEEEHGECHLNFIRKPQYAFSWDWGPTFATVGVAGAVYLEYFNYTTIYRVSPLIKKFDDNNFSVQLDVQIFCHNGTSVTLVSNITGVNLIKQTNFSNLICNTQGDIVSTISHTFLVPISSIQLWFPNGYGAQPLYSLQTQILVNGNFDSEKYTLIGFRTVELVQDQAVSTNDSLGKTFYFKINNIPIFLKGSNFIPISAFYSQNQYHKLRKEFLMESMKQANINALRVWGGGLFESDSFYEMADRYGILLWHDHMFACNVYPIDQDFLDSVRAEVASQVMRLRHHPSILAWAGNNENEAAIVEKWAMWKVENYTQEQQIYDYKILTINTTKPIIDSLDPSRPFLSSSPSNGIETDSNGGVSKFDPNNQFYGDVHFYNEDKNLWKVYTFPIPRCATEFGVQSVPLTNTMTRWVNSSEWTYGSKRMVMRQHHPGGLLNNLDMVFSHFEIPYECDGYNSSNLYNCSFVQTSKDFLNDFAYLSQIHQAIAMQTESEHYRRYRSFIDPDGRGNTMCALYWQLNDIWAAPTWSSIDFDQNWKVLHYYVRRFFAPIIVSLYFDEKNQLNVYVVNDLMNNSNINYSLKLDILTWKNGFTPIYSVTKTINVTDMGSVRVNGIQDDLNSKNITLNDNDEFVIQAILYDSSNQPQSPLAILLPDKMKPISNTDYGDATISNVVKIDDQTYNVTLSATKIVPVLWLDINPSTKEKYQLLYWFSDNGFTMTEPQISVTLTIFSSNETTVNGITLSAQDLTISRMQMSSNPMTPTKTSGINNLSNNIMYSFLLLVILIIRNF